MEVVVIDEALNLIGKLTPEMELIAIQLPPYPAAARKVAQLVANGAATRDIGKALASDSILSIKALRVANSAFYGMSREIGSPVDAAQVLGSSALGALASACALSSFATSKPVGFFNPEHFFGHALLSGCLAKSLARLIGGQDPDAAFSVALLHDIGGALLAVSGDSVHCGCCGSVPESSNPLQTDCLHAQIGAALVLGWDFPVDFALGILTHHDQSRATRLGLITQVSCLGAHAIESNEIVSWALEAESYLNIHASEAFNAASIAEEERNSLKSVLFK